MRDGLTAGLVAERSDHRLQGEDLDRRLRQVRYWTTEGLLLLDSEKHRGPGKHRVYDLSAVYVTAMLAPLSDNGLSIGTLKKAVDCIKYARLEAVKESGIDPWDMAIKGEAPIGFALCFPDGSDNIVGTFLGQRYEKGGKVVVAGFGDIDEMGGSPVMVIRLDLTDIFSRVRN